MRTARLCCSVAWLCGLSTCGWLAACGEKFTAGDSAGAAGVPNPSDSGDGGANHQASEGGEPAVTAGTAMTAAQGGATDEAAGGDGAVGSGTGGDATVDAEPYRDAILADQPLVYWRMGHVAGGVVSDETGGGNGLVLQGDGYVLGVSGAVQGADSAISFDGASGFAVATDPRALDFVGAAAFTLECWARRETGGASYFQHLVSNVEGVANNRDGYALYLLPEPAQGENARSVFERDVPAKDLGVWGSISKPSAWAHYVAVYDGSTATLYVNGSLANTLAAPGNLAARKTPFAVARAGSGSNFFKGSLDEIALYPRALNAATVAAHHLLAK